MSETPVIRAERSVQTYAFAAGLALAGLLMAVLGAGGFVQGVQPWWSPLLFILLGLFTVWLGLEEAWIAELEVSPAQVRFKRWGRWEEHPLSGLDAVDGQRDFLGAGGFNLILMGQQREAVQVPLRRYRNSGVLAQAVLEGAWRHNEELLTTPRLTKRFGDPPYGVFGGKKAKNR